MECGAARKMWTWTAWRRLSILPGMASCSARSARQSEAHIIRQIHGSRKERQVKKDPFGGMYSLWARPTSGETLEVGFDYGSGKQSATVTDAAAGGGLGAAIPETAQFVRPFIRCKVAPNGQYCTVASYLLSLLPSARRAIRTRAVDQAASQPDMDRYYYYDEPAATDVMERQGGKRDLQGEKRTYGGSTRQIDPE